MTAKSVESSILCYTEDIKRQIIDEMNKWRLSKSRKPLVLRGARQVGKTWAMQEFGRLYYDSVAYVNLDGNIAMQNLFELDYDIKRIVDGIELFTNVKVEKGKSLIILDEIQENPRALASLKYFYENEPDYHIVVAGSLLGVALHEGTSFPVGKVDFIDVTPLNFGEFLLAIGETNIANLLDNWLDNVDLVNSFHEKILDIFRTFMIVGGMPEVVKNFIDEDNLLQVRSVQNTILDAYEQDFSKHAPNVSVPRIREIWNILPSQLAKENKKFIFSQIRSGSRAKDYELALLWLEDAGLVGRVTRTKSAKLPLKFYEDTSIFKLFMLDTGLLTAKSVINPQILLAKNAIITEFRGAVAEQMVYQSLVASGIKPYYYTNEASRGEIDFMALIDNTLVPIEVKAGGNLNSKSLSAFIGKHTANKAIKFSEHQIKLNDVIFNLPLYLAGYLSL